MLNIAYCISWSSYKWVIPACSFIHLYFSCISEAFMLCRKYLYSQFCAANNARFPNVALCICTSGPFCEIENSPWLFQMCDLHLHIQAFPGLLDQGQLPLLRYSFGSPLRPADWGEDWYAGLLPICWDPVFPLLWFAAEPPWQWVVVFPAPSSSMV